MALDRRFWLSGRSARGMLLRLLLVLLWEAMVARGTRRRPDLVVVTMGCGLMDVGGRCGQGGNGRRCWREVRTEGWLWSLDSLRTWLSTSLRSVE
jgi:hypothetical protein